MKNEKPFLVGIDLHGTLLNDEWQIEPKLIKELIQIMDDVRDFCSVVICTGNHFGFVKKYVPEKLHAHLDGAIIETGCAYSDMDGNEKSLIQPEEQKVIDKIFATLKTAYDAGEFPEMQYFGERKHSISLFTIHENKGEDPKKLLSKIEAFVEQMGLINKVTVTHSSVAVDIFPKRLSKATGMRELAKEGATIGIADSMNDYALINESDIAFIPKNADQGLIKKLTLDGKKIVSIQDINAYNISDSDVIIQATHNDTRGVIEILQFVQDNLSPK
jgi:hydroxymethylpyrimidine pyrophosphatase-like HAD family hydrolase